MKCEECKIDYPGDLVSVLTSSAGCFRLCGICALEFTNRMHGIKRKCFRGEIAESLRRRALAFRTKQMKLNGDV